MNKQLKVEIHSYWHAGTGRTSGSHVDSLVEKDHRGLPRLSGRHLKGLLRDAVYRACSWGWFDDAGDLETWLFGSAANPEQADGQDSDSTRFATTAGSLFISNAELRKSEQQALTQNTGLRSALYHSLFATAIDEQTGSAKNQSLRGMEVVVPLTLYADINIQSDERQAHNAFDKLQQALSLIDHIGGMRNRGLGRATLTLEDADSNQAATTQATPKTATPGNKTKIPLLITLQDDVIISASATTAGGHSTLDYIPGSLLLGAAAAGLYKSLDSDSAWQAFHSGRIRFHNGYIISEQGEPGLPSPLSLHYYKGQEPPQGQPLSANRIVRPSLDKLDPKRQLKQLRETYLTVSGERVNVATSISIKTAIDKNTGRASEAQLFGYQALCAGQRFLAYLEKDSDTPDALFAQILSALAGEVRIGRSRSAQFGRVHIDVLDNTGSALEYTNPTGQTELSLWCLSDLALFDPQTQQATLQPTPQHFGLQGGHFDAGKSYLRGRSYSPFNGHRNAFDTRRDVICAGSVIHFSDLEPITDQQWQALQRPQGGFVEHGLGVVVANAAICTLTPLKFASAAGDRIPQKASDSSQGASSALLEWLKDKTAATTEHHSAWLDDTSREIEQQYIMARSFNAIDSNQPIGPSPSQWGEVYQSARDLRHKPDELYRKLFGGDNAICRARAGSEYAWGLKINYDTDFSAWLKRRFESDEDLVEKITLLAAEMRRPRCQAMRLAAQESEGGA